MQYFCKLIAPRSDFAHTLTADERALMQQHAVYWHGLMARGLVLVFGLVGDPRGPFGIGILTLDDNADPTALTSADPVMTSGAGFTWEVHPMLSAVVRPEKKD